VALWISLSTCIAHKLVAVGHSPGKQSASLGRATVVVVGGERCECEWEWECTEMEFVGQLEDPCEDKSGAGWVM